MGTKSLFVLVVFVVGCRGTNHSHFAPKEFMDINFSGSNFRYIYYNMKNANDFVYQYCEGTFTKEGNKYTLTPASFDRTRCEATLEEFIDNSLNNKIGLKVESKVYGDFEKKFRMVVHMDSVIVSTYGYRLDTLVTTSAPNQVWVEIFSPSEIGAPVPFESIKTRPLVVKNKNSRSFFIKVPIVYDSFYYVNLAHMIVEDLGNEYLIETTGKHVKKQHWLQ